MCPADAPLPPRQRRCLFLREERREAGIGWVARSHFIEYLRPALAGEAIVVRTWVAGFEQVRSTRRYEMIRAANDTVRARAETTWAFLRLEDGRPIQIPQEVVEAFVVAGESTRIVGRRSSLGQESKGAAYETQGVSLLRYPWRCGWRGDR